ncbi:MAG TPA: methyltransferase domain-containing protein, partial [Xanthobacteraceae bacterium]|nr:methyltransferase domain-containing protein [Xanthobacteraceae bacterium]
MAKSVVQQQFGATAAHYLTSAPHAQGQSLTRLVERLRPQPAWQMLDVATGAGHTAYALAPHVARVWASDITAEMLALVRQEIVRRQLTNVGTLYAKAELLPLRDQVFDLVTCRIAPHHFDSIPAFLEESRRVLKPDGRLGIVDNVVPPGAVGDYINAFERLRDPSHLRAWTMEQWQAALVQCGFAVVHHEMLAKSMAFDSWASRHDATMQALLRAMLSETSSAVKE